jgi:hypothetical protein
MSLPGQDTIVTPPYKADLNIPRGADPANIEAYVREHVKEQIKLYDADRMKAEDERRKKDRKQNALIQVGTGLACFGVGVGTSMVIAKIRSGKMAKALGQTK